MAETAEYDGRMVAMLELIWGKDFLAPGGAGYVRQHLAGLELRGRTVLDVGAGLGGGALVIAGELGARVIGLDIEPALVERARAYAAEAGLAERAEFRLVAPGPFPLPDGAVDLVYSSGAFTQIADKEGLFAECCRVLKPGGRLVVYDWTAPEGPPSEDMRYFFEMEGLTYAMRSLEAHRSLLEKAGFVAVELEDCADWYRAEARREWERMQGPLFATMVETLGRDSAEHFVEDWRSMVVVLDQGELRPARYRARKPRKGKPWAEHSTAAASAVPSAIASAGRRSTPAGATAASASVPPARRRWPGAPGRRMPCATPRARRAPSPPRPRDGASSAPPAARSWSSASPSIRRPST